MLFVTMVYPHDAAATMWTKINAYAKQNIQGNHWAVSTIEYPNLASDQ